MMEKTQPKYHDRYVKYGTARISNRIHGHD